MVGLATVATDRVETKLVSLLRGCVIETSRLCVAHWNRSSTIPPATLHDSDRHDTLDDDETDAFMVFLL
jgi:hypothetical protein